MSKHHVIYIPGLGRDYSQDIAIKCWRLYGVTPHYISMNWSDGESFDVKLKRILDKVDELKTEDNEVSLVGVSAGAGATLNAYASTEKISALVWVCGKINNPTNISSRTYQRNPAFKESMDMVNDSLSALSPERLGRIMSIHPLGDPSVPINDTKVAGTKEKIIFFYGHFLAIAYAITLRGRLISKFLLNSKINTKP